MPRTAPKIARHYVVRGRVQGVGFRYFVEHTAATIGVDGWVRNLDDGRVEVYAIGTPDELGSLEGFLWKGPRWSEVRGVDVRESGLENRRGFHIRH